MSGKALEKILEMTNCGPKARREDSYHIEKVLGIRQKTGASILKKLTPIHKQIIAMHLHGYSVIQIEKETNYSQSHIYKILEDPLAKELIATFSKRMDTELQAMEPLTIAAMRDALESGDMKDRLRAVDIYSKMAGLYVKEDAGPTGFGGHTAESLISKALELADGAIRSGNNARQSIIKGDATDVEDISNSTDIVPQT